MKKISLILFLLLFISISSYADILVKVGILDIDKLMMDFPESKKLREKWEISLNKKHFLLLLLQEEADFLKKQKQGNLSGVHVCESRKINIARILKKLRKNKKADLSVLKKTEGFEIKKKIFLGIKEARRKKGFGLVFSSKRKLILYYDELLDFNPFVLDEIYPEEEREAQNERER